MGNKVINKLEISYPEKKWMHYEKLKKIIVIFKFLKLFEFCINSFFNLMI